MQSTLLPDETSSAFPAYTKLSSIPCLPYVNPLPIVTLEKVRTVSYVAKENEIDGQTDFAHNDDLPDRSIITKSVQICVKCSKMATLCVSCMEATVDTCLQHYRKTRGIGAKRLFDSAVVNTGAYKLNKFLIFRAWKNGSKLRSTVERCNVERAGRWWRNHQLHPLFKAWKLFITNIIQERKREYVDELLVKISLLEQNVNKLSMETKHYPKQIESLINLCAEKDAEILRLSEKLGATQFAIVARDTSNDD